MTPGAQIPGVFLFLEKLINHYKMKSAGASKVCNKKLNNLIAINIKKAIELQANGKIIEAQNLFKKNLQSNPNDFDSLHLLGVMYFQRGAIDTAIEFITKAIVQNKEVRSAPAHTNLGILLSKKNLLEDAKHHYKVAISIDPGFAAAQYNLGKVYKDLGENDAALTSYNQAIVINPKYTEALNNKGNVLRDLLRHEEALYCYSQVIKINPNYFEAINNRGSVLHDLKRYDEALECYENAIKLAPNTAVTYFNKGNALLALKKYEEAISVFITVLEKDPNYAQAYVALGIAYRKIKKPDKSLINFNNALAIDPRSERACIERGALLAEYKHYELAIKDYDLALDINPQSIAAIYSKGLALKEVNSYDEALDCFNLVIKKDINHFGAWLDKGNVNIDQNKIDEAINCFDKAIRISPDFAVAYWNKALALLLLGNHRDGWKLFEWRWKWDEFPSPRRRLEKPLWLGKEDIKGKTILIYWEQGLGDVIQMSRYIPIVAKLGAKIILEVQSHLVNLLRTVEGIAQIIPSGSNLPEYDYQCPIMSLPLAFATNIDTIPTSEKYLVAENHKFTSWSKKLGKKKGIRVGLVWSGSTVHAGDKKRTIKISTLLPYLPSDIDYVCLQKEIRAEDLSFLKCSNIKSFTDEINDFTDTAALCELMDVVISVDTSVAHLSAALGKKTWILIPYAPDWRWMLDRNDSPWYPSVKLYRQINAGDWEIPLKKMFNDLCEIAKSSKSVPCLTVNSIYPSS